MENRCRKKMDTCEMVMLTVKQMLDFPHAITCTEYVFIYLLYNVPLLKKKDALQINRMTQDTNVAT